MPWFKVDDGFSNSKPVLRIPRRFRPAAVGLWTLAGAWSAKELTDGYVPDYLLEELASTPTMARHLVDAGLWEEAENGWKFKGWGKYQPTREQVTADREREAERKRQWRASKRSPGGTDSGRTLGHQAESGHPDPTRPDPTHTPSSEVADATESELPSRFDEFWDTYGKKVGRSKARTEYRKALKKRGVTEELLIAAAAAYVAHCKAEGKFPKYAKDPERWLKGEHWSDERPTGSASKTQTEWWLA